MTFSHKTTTIRKKTMKKKEMRSLVDARDLNHRTLIWQSRFSSTRRLVFSHITFVFVLSILSFTSIFIGSVTPQWLFYMSKNWAQISQRECCLSTKEKLIDYMKLTTGRIFCNIDVILQEMFFIGGPASSAMRLKEKQLKMGDAVHN